MPKRPRSRGDSRSILPADVGHLDPRDAGCRGRAQLRVPIGAHGPQLGDAGLESGIVRAAADQRAEVVPARGEQARVESALGREPCPGAPPAEGLRDGRDDADLAGAVGIAPAFGRLADYRNLADYIARLQSRPAYRKALERGGPYNLAA